MAKCFCLEKPSLFLSPDLDRAHWGNALVLVILGCAFYSVDSPSVERWLLAFAFCVFVPTLFWLNRACWLNLRGAEGIATLRVSEDGLVFALEGRTLAVIPTADVLVLGKPPLRRSGLIIGRRRRATIILPPNCFTGPEQVEEVRDAIQAEICKLPDGARRLETLWSTEAFSMPWMSLGVTCLLVALFVLQSQAGVPVIALGAAGRDFLQAEPFRLLSASLLHAAWWHVAPNAFGLLAIGWQAESCLDRTRWLLAVGLGGISGVAFFLLSHTPGLYCVGASYGIMSLAGAMVVTVIGRPRRVPPTLRFKSGMVAELLGLCVATPAILSLWPAATAMLSKVDSTGHVVGFVTGCILGLAWLPGDGRARLWERALAWGVGGAYGATALFLVYRILTWS